MFSKITKNIKREQWDKIVTSIVESLEGLNQKWYKSTIHLLTKHIKINNEILQGEGLLEVISYQLYIISSLIAANQYIAPQDAHDFTVLLQKTFLGDKFESCRSYYLAYLNFIGKPDKATEHFARKMAVYITGIEEEEDARYFLVANGGIHTTCPIFLTLNNMHVALCFNDIKTVNYFKKVLDDFGKNV